MSKTITYDGCSVDGSLTVSVSPAGVSWSGNLTTAYGGSYSGGGANGHGSIGGTTALGGTMSIQW